MKGIYTAGALAACVISTALALPSMASATPERCSGAPKIGGQGSSLQKFAQEDVWIPGFTEGTNELACAGRKGQGDETKLEVSYNPDGSGVGMRSWGVEPLHSDELAFGPANAFIGTDEPLNVTEQEEIETHEHTFTKESVAGVPVAQESIAIIVNLPTGCTATSTSAPGRLALSDAELEGVFAGTVTKWGEINTDEDTLSPSSCDEQPIVPVVRGDRSGTTHILKRYLNLIEPVSLETTRGFLTWGLMSEGYLNTEWPTAASVQRSVGEGGTFLIKKMLEHPGSIGYVNLAEARQAGYFVPPTGGAGTATFWVKLENGAKGIEGEHPKLTYMDPSTNGDVAEPAKANCKGATYTNGELPFAPPHVTEPNWNFVTTSVPGPDSPVQKVYSLCNLTYILAFTKYSLLDGVGATEGEATSVENYLTFLVGKGAGQTEIAGHDYEALPKDVQAISEKGAAEIGF
jgi:ABC-type phosphate transport system substrate-binding protein